MQVAGTVRERSYGRRESGLNKRRESSPRSSDGAGRFEFKGLAAGRYTVTAEKTGFVKTRYGSKNDLDPPVPVEF